MKPLFVMLQGINDVVCTVEDMGVIRAHMSNSTDTWILGNMEEAKYVLGNKLGENYYQVSGTQQCPAPRLPCTLTQFWWHVESHVCSYTLLLSPL
jgi:hypothetical protein